LARLFDGIRPSEFNLVSADRDKRKEEKMVVIRVYEAVASEKPPILVIPCASSDEAREGLLKLGFRLALSSGQVEFYSPPGWKPWASVSLASGFTDLARLMTALRSRPPGPANGQD